MTLDYNWMCQGEDPVFMWLPCWSGKAGLLKRAFEALGRDGTAPTSLQDLPDLQASHEHIPQPDRAQDLDPSAARLSACPSCSCGPCAAAGVASWWRLPGPAPTSAALRPFDPAQLLYVRCPAQVYIRLQWVSRVVRGVVTRLEAALAGLSLSIAGGLQARV